MTLYRKSNRYPLMLQENAKWVMTLLFKEDYNQYVCTWIM